MSDAGRKDWSDKMKESVVPDSTKSTQTKVGETFTDAGDKLARGTQPDSDKSAGQSFTDKMGRSKDEHKHGGSEQSVLDKAKSAVGLGDKH